MIYWLIEIVGARAEGGTTVASCLSENRIRSGLGDEPTHQYNDPPIIMAGGGKRVKAGQHINMPEGTPLANLWLTQARMMGVDMKRFADSTGEIGAVKG